MILRIIKAPVELGHIPGWEHRRLVVVAEELKMTQGEFNDFINTNPQLFRLENRSENRSHKNELPGIGELERIRERMKAFLKENRREAK